MSRTATQPEQALSFITVLPDGTELDTDNPAVLSQIGARVEHLSRGLTPPPGLADSLEAVVQSVGLIAPPEVHTLTPDELQRRLHDYLSKEAS